MDASVPGSTSLGGTRPDDGVPPLGDIFRLLPEPVLLLDGEARVRWGNPASEELFGLTADMAVGISALDFVHPDDVELVLRSLESVQDKEIGTLIEVRVHTTRGWTLIEVIGRFVPEIGEGNILFCLRDLTERRRFEVARDDNARFRSVLQNAPFVTMLVSRDGTVESASAALTRLTGHDPEIVEGRAVTELFPAADHERIDAAFTCAAGGVGASAAHVVEVACRRHDDSGVVPVEMTIVSLLEDQTVNAFVVSMQDLSQRAMAEQELRGALSLLSATLESTADGILVVDDEGAMVSFNRRFAELWHIPPELLLRRNSAESLDFVQSQLADPDEFSARVADLYAHPEAESVDTLTFLDGRVFERYSMPQRVGDEIVGRVWSFRDVTERKRLEESLAHRAFHDSLTGLANKDLFLERLQRACDQVPRGGLVGVLFIDVDGLKEVNDRFGHHSGDLLLATVADVLRRCVRPGDTVARLGGDEFGIVAEGLESEKDATGLAERILASLPGSFSVDDVPVGLSVSIGISFDEPTRSPVELVREADAAMYLAKQRGRGGYELAEVTGEAH